MDKDYLIKKWLTNDLNEEEQKAFESLEDHDLHTAIVEEAPRFRASNFSEVPSFETLETRLPEVAPKHNSRWLLKISVAASVLFMGVAFYFLFLSNEMTQVKTLAAEKNTFELPDMSEITLNALSEIRYNEKNWEENRELDLDGEAYFKVAKGKVFDVITEEGIVTVVGTEFNVKQRQGYFEVKCYEGVVKVTSKNTAEELFAGETFRLYGGKVTVGTTLDELPKWTLNISEFKAVPFNQVIKELERQYNISVTYNNSFSERLFSGGFVHNDLENALNSISAPLDLTYQKESSNLVRLTTGER